MTQGEKEARYSAGEQMIVSAAHQIIDNDVVYVGVGVPMVATLLAKYTHAPNCITITENGIVRVTKFPMNESTDVQTMADQLPGMFYVNCLAQAGYINTGFLGAGQIDRYGNINTTVVGDFYKPEHRWNGSGGGNDVISFCHRTIVTIRQSRRRFLQKVDFITSPGYLDGRPGQREEIGLPPNTGPSVVISNLGIYTFEDREMALKSIHSDLGVTLDQVKAEVGWDIKIALDLTDTEPPTDEELRLLREVVDPQRIFARRAESSGWQQQS
ncbi:MAG: CoA-transferase [Chloroflexota bacterium]